jgi:hypothetical protein
VVEWWHFRRPSEELRKLVCQKSKFLALSRVSEFGAVTFIPGAAIANSDVICFHFETYGAFCALQSRAHEGWARFFASSLEDRLRYTPSDCFETFPLPEGFEADPRLEAVGREYYDFRAELMVERKEGLTKIYNRFHDRDERLNAVGELRRLHDAMDRAVLDAYGWTNIRPTCEFELEWEGDEAENGHRRRKPWRYRWPEPVRDEVLARLLALNAQRAEEKRLALEDR